MWPSLNSFLVSDGGGDKAGPVWSGDADNTVHLLEKVTALPQGELEQFLVRACSKLDPKGKMKIALELKPGLSVVDQPEHHECQICSSDEDLVVMACCWNKNPSTFWCMNCVMDPDRSNYHQNQSGHNIRHDNGFFFTLANHFIGRKPPIMVAGDGMGNDAVNRPEGQHDPMEGAAAVAVLPPPRVSEEEDLPDGVHENGLRVASGGGVALRQPEVVRPVDPNVLALVHRDGLPEGGNRYVGKCCLKVFYQKPFLGTVVAWDKNEGQDLYHVVYDDSVSSHSHQSET